MNDNVDWDDIIWCCLKEELEYGCALSKLMDNPSLGLSYWK